MTNIAILHSELRKPASSFRILPAGAFRALDGRPTDLTSWVLTPQRAEDLVSQAANRLHDYIIDYEHATLTQAKHGNAAPAAGWFKSLRFIPEDGLYADEVKWTERAAAYIESCEYRYVSPVFTFDPKSGEVLKLHSLAITNDPGLGGLTDLAALSAIAGGGAEGLTIDQVKSVQYVNAMFASLGTLHPDTDRMCAQVGLRRADYLRSVGYPIQR